MNQIQLKESKPHYTRASKQFANHQVNTAEIPKSEYGAPD